MSKGIQLFGACRVLSPFCLTSVLEALYKALLGHCSRKQDHSRVGGFGIQRTSWGQAGCWVPLMCLWAPLTGLLGSAASDMSHRHLRGDSCRREGLSQVLISSPPQMSTLARLLTSASTVHPVLGLKKKYLLITARGEQGAPPHPTLPSRLWAICPLTPGPGMLWLWNLHLSTCDF